MVKVNEAKNLYKVYVEDKDPFITEAVVFDNRVKEVTLDELRDIMEDYCMEFYEKHNCEPVSREVQMKIKSEVLDILSNYIVDDVLNTDWEVDVVPVVSGFKINVYGHTGNLK